MDAAAWKAFSAARSRYKAYVEGLAASLPGLAAAQQRLVDAREGGSFRVETPVVYNGALDDLGPDSEPKLLLVADNPGRREQAAENRRYLVGPSGKIAAGWFAARPEFGIDFYRDAVILNKTPLHTPRTAELRELARLGGPEIAAALEESQRAMVSIIKEFHDALNLGRKEPAGLWIIGYSELPGGKLFEPFAQALTEAYAGESEALRASVLLLRHFSMNQFSADVRKSALPGEGAPETVARIGAAYRLRVLGW